MKIKNIIFDMGGVILNIDPQCTQEAFKKLGVLDSNNFFKNNKSLIEKFGAGEINAANFRQQLQHNLDINVSDEIFDKAWNAMLLNIPAKRLALIAKLKTQYKIFLLSNTNIIHKDAIGKILQDRHSTDSFKNYFDKEYYSHETGQRKPDSLSYTMILNENNLNADETIFIDDTLSYVEGAKNVGISSIHLQQDLNELDIDKQITQLEKTAKLQPIYHSPSI